MSAQDDYRASQRQGRKAHDRAVSKARHPKKNKKPSSKRPRKPSVLDDPGYVTRPRTMRDINRDADSATGLRYGEQESALQMQRGQIPAWFEQYKGQVQGINQGIQQGYQKALADQAAQTAATQTANDSSRGQLQSSMQKDAASRGASVDPGVLRDDAAAANVRRQSGDDFASLLRTQGAATGDYFGGVQAAASGQQVAEQARNADLIRALGGEKGQYRSQYVSEGRDAERKYELERSAFGLDVAQEQNKVAIASQTAAQKRKDARAKQRDKNQDQGLAGRKFKSDQAKDDYQRRNKLGPYKVAAPKAKGKPTAKTVETKSTVRKGVKQVRDADDGTPGYWKGAFDELVSENGLDPVVARAIVQGARVGRLGPKTRKALRDDYGIDGFKFSRPKRRKSVKPVLNPFD